ncbi:MAG: 3-methyl-2-oxobutanoate hydroxymethyltransferase [Blastopirellula sp.]|nr:MAG: 3-methyl-2-oxobutanoate hydroxymethyltransferase [Blastopirellula sp.]
MSKPMTVADLRAARGKKQLSMLRVETIEEAAAAELAGIDLVSLPPSLVFDSKFRTVAPSLFACSGLDFGIYITEEECLRAAHKLIAAGADMIYCPQRTQTIRRLSEEGIPVCGHTGLIPSKATWTGGFKAVGKTIESAQLVWQQVSALEEAGAVAAEIEVVPEEIATEIAANTSLVLISMGAGSGCHAQYLFSEDVLGQTVGHIPRHAKTYEDFQTKLEKLQAARVKAYQAFKSEVTSGAYPSAEHNVSVKASVLSEFQSWLKESQ